MRMHICLCGFELNPNGWCEPCKKNRYDDRLYYKL